ncbi:MAG TPA: hypothetical protein ENJ77_01110, partial [Candidatus Moranbacteria bacterium]|nr:hypothetical protein [Candidatus Moranbacteria bacterium]
MAQIKKWLADISPDDFSDRYLGRLILLPDMDDDSMAFVEKNFSSGKWDVYVNLRSLAEGKKEMIFTLIHEFAHILTLNEKQIDEEASPSSCETFWIEEGCARAGGYLAGFYDRFWREEGEDFSPEPSPDETLARYEERPESYVTEYAAANPVEDLAESFAAFIFRQ